MRTETKEFKIYKFEELSKKSQARALEKYYNINTDYEWWDGIEEYFIETAKEKGFEVDKIYFSGFYSQGDGAMFEGKINNNIIEHIKPAYRNENYKRDFNRVLKLIKNENINIFGYFKHSGHYYHSKCYIDSLEYEFPENYNNLSNIEYILEDIFAEVRDFYEDLCNELYRNLDKEYEYLTSEEAIIETFEINDYEFHENGKLY